MATKSAPKNDETKARARYVDQKGQWINTTPASVKKKQSEAWKRLEKSMKGNKSNGKRNK